MMKFHTYLHEDAHGLKHIPHVEDMLLTDPFTVVEMMYDMGKLLQTGNRPAMLHVSLKWDGSPSIVFGPDPRDGQFFIATKSAFNVIPKLAKSPEDIATMYPALVEVLTPAFTALQCINTPVILQGDLLFTPAMKSVVEHGGRRMVTFQPNTIRYASDISSPEGYRIMVASVGVALHTMYRTSTQSAAAEIMTPDVFARLTKTADVVLWDASDDAYSMLRWFDIPEAEDFLLAMSALDEVPFREMRRVFQELMQSGRFADLFARFLHVWSRTEQDEAPLSALTSYITQEGEIDDLVRMRSFSDVIREFFVAFCACQRVKGIILNQMKHTFVETFFDTGGEWIPTSHEGLVVTWGGKRCKFVQRDAYTQRNVDTWSPK